MARRQRDYLTIGEVVERLSEDFGDLSVSKIRFLEEEGLITPERTPGGYRKFHATDVSRIEMILVLQRDHFLPLAVIKDRLAEADRGRVPDELKSKGTMQAVALPLEEEGSVSLANAPARLGIPAAFLKELIEFALVKPIGSGSAAELDRRDVEIAHLCWDARKWGMEPRHLRMFEQFAEREAGLASQALMPGARVRTPEARQKVMEQLGELGETLDELKRHLIGRALSSAFEDAT